MMGHRVDSLGEVIHADRPGDYFPVLAENGEVKGLWFRLPTGSIGRIAAKGHGKNDEPEWEITLNADATITVDPSIKQDAVHNIPAWHGHLVDGEWRD